MKKSLLFFFLILLTPTSSSAGTLINGAWSPSGCEKPEPPIIESASAEKFNQSVDAINEWQDRALKYNSCLIKEANADSELITKTANDVLANMQKEIDRVVTEAENVRVDLK